MGLSGAKNIFRFEFPIQAPGGHTVLLHFRPVKITRPVLRGTVSFLYLSPFVCSRTRFRRFVVKCNSATGDKIEKDTLRLQEGGGGERRMEMLRIGFLRDESLSKAALLLGGMSFNDRAICRGKYDIVV